MLLDVELLEIYKETDCTTADEIHRLNIILCKKCENHYKDKLSLTQSRKEVKAILDQAFDSFDSFVNLAQHSSDFKLNALGELFAKFTFRTQFMNNADIAELYNKL